MEIEEFMIKYSKIIDKISIEYTQNYKTKGYSIVGGNDIGGKAFIQIVKLGKTPLENECAQSYTFEKGEGEIAGMVAMLLQRKL